MADPHSPPKQPSAARGTVTLSAAHGILMLCGYVVVVTLARGLGPETYGTYGVILSVLITTELVGRLGIPQAVSKLIAGTPGQSLDYERTGLTLTAVTYFLLFVAFWCAAPWLARLYSIENGTALFRLASIDIPVYGLYFLCEHVLNGHRRFGEESIGVTLYGVAKAGGVLLLLFLGLTITSALIVNILASAVALFYVGSRIDREAFHPSVASARPLLALAAPTALFVAGSEVLFYLDFWCLRALGAVSDEVTGLYYAAISVARIPNIAQFVMMAVLLPMVSSALSRGDRALATSYVRGAMRFLIIVLVPSCALIAMRADGLMQLAYADRYTGGGGFLALQVFRYGVMATFLNTFCAVLIGGDRARSTAWLTVGWIPVAIVTYLVVVPRHGAQGAAVAALALSVGNTAAAAMLVRRWLGPLLELATLVKVALTSIAMAALLSTYSVPPWALLIELPAYLAAYVLVLRGTGVLSPEDFAHFLPGRSGKRAG